MYDGGYLDMTFLGCAEVDSTGNVNVSKFGPRCIGPGGFIDISQNTPKIYFLSTFTAGKSKFNIADGKLEIIEDGTGIKFVKNVQQITFSAEYARRTGQQVYYITERAVFKLVDGGVMLVEISPGIDLQRDVLDKMAFRPIISDHLKTMDPRLFSAKKMGLDI